MCEATLGEHTPCRGRLTGSDVAERRAVNGSAARKAGIRGRVRTTAPAFAEEFDWNDTTYTVDNGVEHVPQQVSEEPVHGMRRIEDMRAYPRKEPVQGVLGSNFCPHKRRKSQCKEIGESRICEHDLRRSKCKEGLSARRARARNAGDRTYASMTATGASARRAGARNAGDRRYARPWSHQEPVQGVPGRQHLPAQARIEHVQGVPPPCSLLEASPHFSSARRL